MEPKDRIIVALDVSSLEEVDRFVGQLAPYVGCFKIGLQLFTAVGPKAVELVHKQGGQVFLDLKFNDIPATMAGSAKSAADLSVLYFNVHASAGVKGMKAAVVNKGNAKVLAVTVLTSLSSKECEKLFGASTLDMVETFAGEASNAGVDGIICSPQELARLHSLGFLRPDLLYITPGVRPTWASANDQQRVMTPAEAIAAGASALVIGRPITNPPADIGSPVEAAKRIAEEIATTLA